ncbi:MAG: hypothetical protein ABSD41_04520 [Candidatus Bathyarchaeia archaeon]
MWLSYETTRLILNLAVSCLPVNWGHNPTPGALRLTPEAAPRASTPSLCDCVPVTFVKLRGEASTQTV